MIEIIHNLFIGSGEDCLAIQHEPSWYIIHAAQIPWFKALNVNNIETLWVRTDNTMTLNLIDARDSKYISKAVIDETLNAINTNRDKKILVHCNMGLSRAPSIGFLYLLKHSDLLRKENLVDSLEDYRKIYPQYNPGLGLQMFISYYYKDYI